MGAGFDSAWTRRFSALCAVAFVEVAPRDEAPVSRGAAFGPPAFPAGAICDMGTWPESSCAFSAVSIFDFAIGVAFGIGVDELTTFECEEGEDEERAGEAGEGGVAARVVAETVPAVVASFAASISAFAVSAGDCGMPSAVRICRGVL